MLAAPGSLAWCPMCNGACAGVHYVVTKQSTHAPSRPAQKRQRVDTVNIACVSSAKRPRSATRPSATQRPGPLACVVHVVHVCWLAIRSGRGRPLRGLERHSVRRVLEFICARCRQRLWLPAAPPRGFPAHASPSPPHTGHCRCFCHVDRYRWTCRLVQRCKLKWYEDV